MARAMIDSVDRSPAPRRLALGSDAYGHIRTALEDRLAALDAQKDIALSTDTEVGQFADVHSVQVPAAATERTGASDGAIEQVARAVAAMFIKLK